MGAHSVFLILFGVAAIAIVVHGQGQAGFISIDCGSPPNINYVDTDTGISYTWDAPYINSGVNANVSKEYGYPANPVLPFPLADVRSFPQGNRNCYTLTPSDGKGNLYLIRASFMYGNYDGQKALPEFDLYVNVNFWSTVTFRNASENVIKEILTFAETDTVYVCLVNKGKGTPFISALELRPTNSSIYGTEFGRNVSLVLYRRYDTGYLNGTGRYQNDVYDRIWSPYSQPSWNTTMTTGYIDIFQSGYKPPDEVIKTAAYPRSNDEPLELSWTSDDPNARFYAYLYFAELESLKRDESRKIKIFWNGSPVSGPFNPSPEYSMTLSNSRAFTGKDHWISVQKASDSTLPPILNAIEIFTAQSLDESPTTAEEVYAMESIRSTYSVQKAWTGDPCAPRLFPWEGVGCIYNDSDDHHIKSLNLSSSGLQGPIALAFGNLSYLESLDLSNNNLRGFVPNFLADLKQLKYLNLKGNNFVGFIPKALRKESKSGGLALSVDEQNICHSRSCRDGNSIVVPIVVSTLLILLIAALVIICVIRRERKIGAYSGPLLPSGKRRFTYSEVSSITNNFDKVIGKGGFGIVYLGSLEDGTEIAVKMINDSSFGKNKGSSSSSSSSSSKVSKEFQVEAELLLTVHHRNLASFVGYCDDGRRMALIYEYMANGNLQDYLSSEAAEDLSWEKRLHIAIDSAQGLEYLHHGCRPPIVHRDVKTANILLNDNLESKIADFGLSKVFPEDDLSHVVTAVMGTPGYVDPEYYNTFKLNEKSDVYSFGIVLLEIITGRRSIMKTDDGDKMNVVHYVEPFLEIGDIDGVVDARLQGDFSSNSAWKFVEIAMSCVKDRGIHRPTMNQIVSDLKQCLAAELAREPQSLHEKKEKNTKTAPVRKYSVSDYISSTGSVSLTFGDYNTYGPTAR
ncbi:putative LRR receptor-like serine/threonine-protein kinase [Raphanus sativus]|nr:putative LRR receptor-like serine/threonine-protein kinase [Raphanus sativus]